MTFYLRTELVWVVLVLADLVIQATKTSHSSDHFLDILSEPACYCIR